MSIKKRATKPQSKPWDLEQEIEFVNKLGTFTNRFKRQDLLEGYKKSLAKRPMYDHDRIMLTRVVDTLMSVSEE